MSRRFVRAITGEWWNVAMIAAATPHPETGIVIATLKRPVSVPLLMLWRRMEKWEAVEHIVISAGEWARVSDD